ncbi:Ppx/GppA family phosphatase [Lactiplantibacillus plantarum]|uniref:Ppx/GppA family phosphatase n=1 Tax=Lactiplantibacillus plantarum TaxID=1590 RepID=UPI0005FA9BE7|nr:Ppx/GppA family phosphatase [Lactiplantibacillus plantarum]MCG0571608.1 exopolyphosphatase [Lactiplantibacillus plantarum]MCG0674051.1 exopolyphosphatase [Lactiplantibacillus plantarum]MCG0809146.1 exopolyphosphatase [Lactiplantibacillus plantarum]MCG0862714.1 exopolyphosphatase [Lactiplantibacillus plantarum]
MRNLAIVDLGSNSARMAISRLHANGTVQEIKRVKEDTRLSEGMGTAHVLQPAAIERTIKALLNFRRLYEKMPNTDVIGITTAAVRMAQNQAEFLNQVKQEVGLDLRVLSGDDEAYYDYLGVANSLVIHDCLILDTGGASCELILVKNGRKQQLISIPFGAVTLSEQFGLDDLVPSASLFRAQMFLRNRLADIWWLSEAVHFPIILLGGANRTLARINRRRQQKLKVEDIHGYRLKTETVFHTFLDLLSRSKKGRQEISGMEYDRADIIVGGMLPLVTLLQMLDSDRVIFSESGVREGIISEHLNQ